MNSIQFRAEEDWTVAELETFLHQLNILYSRLYIVDQFKGRGRLNLSRILARPVSLIPRDEQLMVDYIEMHSPALIGLKGVDKIIKQLRLSVRDACDHSRRRDEDARDSFDWFIGVMKENGFSQEEIQDFIRNNFQKPRSPVKKILKLTKKLGVFLDSDAE